MEGRNQPVVLYVLLGFLLGATSAISIISKLLSPKLYFTKPDCPIKPDGTATLLIQVYMRGVDLHLWPAFIELWVTPSYRKVCSIRLNPHDTNRGMCSFIDNHICYCSSIYESDTYNITVDLSVQAQYYHRLFIVGMNSTAGEYIFSRKAKFPLIIDFIHGLYVVNREVYSLEDKDSKIMLEPNRKNNVTICIRGLTEPFSLTLYYPDAMIMYSYRLINSNCVHLTLNSYWYKPESNLNNNLTVDYVDEKGKSCERRGRLRFPIRGRMESLPEWKYVLMVVCMALAFMAITVPSLQANMNVSAIGAMQFRGGRKKS